jgi:hypothetical protein
VDKTALARAKWCRIGNDKPLMYATKAFFTKNSTFVQSKAGLNADDGSTASQGCPRRSVRSSP